MILSANGKTYEVEDISISTELYVHAADEEEGLQIFRELTNLQSFTLNGEEYAGLVVSKISLIVLKNESTKVIVRLRAPAQADINAQLESVRAQLEELQAIVAPIMTDSKNGAASTVKDRLAERFPELLTQTEEVK